ncbi:kinesin-domain-containing protein [Tilletiaria anomala UBC 951]|uniref:Kinesin-domain-containing protein n=1 Tax=Tilletiaria anomala (strain ATCC 24038 / CBS 436.72 / UBC 951) TaxID=1037660 RepID=A0A066W6R4_TILAU|nr:kinesin-domain-containing protein [Tilletiaria anomala UBC 951]KDN46460.1 kinesin-domain-containing protein [Tilletiaria anomala UBC 951]
MAESSITVAVRVRPFSAKEAALLAPVDTYQPFLGDGGLGGSPFKAQQLGAFPSSAAASTNLATGAAASGGSNAAAGPGPGSLRTKYLRSIVSPVDDKVLIFDPPDTNPLTRLYASTANTFAHGARRYKDVRYAFDRVFPDHSTQQDVFENTTKPLLDGILRGYNASVFAYGATGCGKTHTISGTAEDPGIIFLTMRELYQRVADCNDEMDVNIRLSYLEIYNETIRDLLSNEPTPPGQGLALREDSANKISVVGISEHSPQSPVEVLDMITEGNKRRTMSPTEANAVSSRSHAVLQINVTQRPRTAGLIEEMTSASLNIIDLAGSERAAATRNNGQRMKEGANINKSLLALGNCINALCQSGGQKGRHVPYRNSKLTRLLKFSLGGNCKTVMIVCASPSSAHYEETHNTLKYANQAKNIRTKVTRNLMNVDRHVAQYVQAIHELNEEVAQLKAKLAEKGQLDSAAEKRRKAEVAKEVEEAKHKMRDSTERVKNLVCEKSSCEAVLDAARLRSTILRARQQTVASEIQTTIASGNAAPSDLESEQDILEQMIAQADAIATDPALLASIRSLNNSLQMQQAIIIAASHNTRFDADASETIKNLGTTFQAEINALRCTVKLEAMLEAVRESNLTAQVMTTLATRCTVAAKEAAGELDYYAGRMKAGDTIDGLQSAISSLAGQFRDVAAVNDSTLLSATGARTATVAAPAGAPTRNSAIRRARQSLSQAALPSPSPAKRVAVTAPAPVPAPAPARMAHRQSLQTSGGASHGFLAPTPLSPITASPACAQRVSTGYAAPTAASRAHVVGSPRIRVMNSPRRMTRRQSLMAIRRTSSVSATNAAGAKPAAAVADKKKAFRWADEAGEGKIDDAGSPLKMKSAASVHPLRQHITSRGDDMEPPTTTLLDGAHHLRIKANSEWEDVMLGDQPAKPPSASTARQSIAAKRLPSSRSGPLNAGSKNGSGAVTAPAKRSASTSSIEHDKSSDDLVASISLSSSTAGAAPSDQRAAACRSFEVAGKSRPAAEAEGGDASRPSERVRLSLSGNSNNNMGSAPSLPSTRVAFSDVRNISGSACNAPSNSAFANNDENAFEHQGNQQCPLVHGSETRGTPYKRRESSGGSGSRVGPVRRARGSLSSSSLAANSSGALKLGSGSKVPAAGALASPGALALPPVFAAIAKERDALASASAAAAPGPGGESAPAKPKPLARGPPGNTAARAAAAAAAATAGNVNADSSSSSASTSTIAAPPSSPSTKRGVARRVAATTRGIASGGAQARRVSLNVAQPQPGADAGAGAGAAVTRLESRAGAAVWT